MAEQRFVNCSWDVGRSRHAVRFVDCLLLSWGAGFWNLVLFGFLLPGRHPIDLYGVGARLALLVPDTATVLAPPLFCSPVLTPPIGPAVGARLPPIRARFLPFPSLFVIFLPFPVVPSPLTESFGHVKAERTEFLCEFAPLPVLEEKEVCRESRQQLLSRLSIRTLQVFLEASAGESHEQTTGDVHQVLLGGRWHAIDLDGGQIKVERTLHLLLRRLLPNSL
mmetsp:Transcript_31280/g.83225  ORF Transcript_31280/g.83225 Transcript_31280/m.83225 type:complete len:222 (-) Transcript_31280:376-1041(-)